MLSTQTLATEANNHHQAAQNKARQAVAHALEAGRALAKAKAQLPHGQWADWLAVNFKGSDRHARRYIALATKLDTLPESKRTHVADLPSLRQALEAVTDDKPKHRAPTAPPENPPAWLPRSTRTVATWRAREPLNDDDTPPVIKIQRDADSPDHWQLWALTEAGECIYTKRGILGSHLPRMFEVSPELGALLPEPEAGPWEYQDIGRDFVRTVLIDTLEPMQHQHP